VIVDSHHHVWRVRDNLWLQGPMVPRIFGPYEAIRRDYLADEFIADATGAGVERSVYVQTNWPLERSLDEVRWVQQVHEESGWPHAIVGAADLFREDAPALFEAQAAASPLMRGIRQQLHWHPNEQYRFASAPDLMGDPVLRRNVARLAEYGWVFELQVFSNQMADAARGEGGTGQHARGDEEERTVERPARGAVFVQRAQGRHAPVVGDVAERVHA